MISELRNRKSLTFYQSVQPVSEHIFCELYEGRIESVALANNAFSTSNQFININNAWQQLKTDLIARGSNYVGNSTASRGGFMAEEFVKGTYNLDAAIKKNPSNAITVKSTASKSADIIYDGDKKASLKFYSNAKGSAKAQLDPGYGEQERIVPSDQLDEAKVTLDKMASKNDLKNRTDVAKSQRNTSDLLNDCIKGDDGTQSTPLTKEQDMQLASAISKDDSTNKVIVDDKKIDNVLKKTGVKSKKNEGIMRNELRGVGIAAAIGAGVGFTIGFAITLAQSGVTPDTIKYAVAEGGKSGVLAGSQSVMGYGIGRTLGQLAVHALEGTLSNLGVEITENISRMCNIGVVGALTITVFSAYQFCKLIHAGVATKEAALQVGKQTFFSLSLLAVSIAAQGIWGGPAALIVSISTGIIFITYMFMDIVYQRLYSDKIRVYMINKCKPSFA